MTKTIAEIIAQRRSKYIRDGIYNDIRVSVQERPRHTFLGSTDRKGYTLEFRATYLDKDLTAYVEIEPHFSEDDTKKMVDKCTEDARHKMAEKIFKELYE